MSNKNQNPMSEYLLKIQLIVDNAEFKNKAEADKYETMETKRKGVDYVNAKLKTDIFESYQYDGREVYTLLFNAGYTDEQIFNVIEHPEIMPQTYKNILLERARELLINNYVEPNKYYLTLLGYPSPDEETLIVPDDFYFIYKDDNAFERNTPVHLLPKQYQELFMNSSYYKTMMDEHPDSAYLKYIGSNSIPLEVSRPAYDGNILRVNTQKLSTYNEIFGNVTVSPEIVHKFITVYTETRDYVYDTLRGEFSSIYPNYNSFIRFLTIYLSIGNTLNEFMKNSKSLIYMNDVTANNFFMLYGLPNVIMEGVSMVELLKKFRLILMDKGTNIVYRIKDLIGYEYTDIYTLVMVKQQIFENGVPVYYISPDGTKTPKQEIVFRRMGTTDDNTSYFKYKESNIQYTVDQITSGDPRWWNTPEVESMLNDMNYTLSNSKYIQLSTHLSMTDIWWESVILLRGLLDRKKETQFAMLDINASMGETLTVSVFEAVLILVVFMNYQLKDFNNNPLSGDMYIPNGSYNGKMCCLDLMFNGLNDDGSPKELTLGAPYKIASFNYDFRDENPLFYESMYNKSFLEPDILMPMLESIFNHDSINVGEVLMTDAKLVYKHLEEKLRTSTTIQQFRDVTDVFNKLFLVDPVRDWADSENFDIDALLCDSYDITPLELSSLKSFYSIGDKPQLIIEYNDKSYPINLYNVLNNDVKTIVINDETPFTDNDFVTLFVHTMSRFVSNDLMMSSISQNIKNNYQSIICDKVILESGNTEDGPATFESLLFRTNPSLYRYVMTTKQSNEMTISLLRSIIKSLEAYVNTSLSGLEFNALGEKEYFRILKEVITYFKSYMVEFTKDEFVYVFDGLFDNGGNSNMLRLYDEMTHIENYISPIDSLTLFDVAHFDQSVKMEDNNIGVLYDDAIFRVETTYQNLKSSGYELWYDNGKTITQTPFEIDDDEKIIANMIHKDDTYMIIINIDNIDRIPPNYVGNVL